MIDLLLDLADPTQRFKLLDAVRALKPARYSVLIKQDRPSRSNAQNRYYWKMICELFAGWARDMGNEGYTKERAHAFFANKFLVEETAGKGGEAIGATVRSTTELSTVEMSDYMEQCIRFIAEFCEIEVPMPTYD